jgi:hypothetical protein
MFIVVTPASVQIQNNTCLPAYAKGRPPAGTRISRARPSPLGLAAASSRRLHTHDLPHEQDENYSRWQLTSLPALSGLHTCTLLPARASLLLRVLGCEARVRGQSILLMPASSLAPMVSKYSAGTPRGVQVCCCAHAPRCGEQALVHVWV